MNHAVAGMRPQPMMLLAIVFLVLSGNYLLPLTRVRALHGFTQQDVIRHQRRATSRRKPAR
jgi:hypothetical protein